VTALTALLRRRRVIELPREADFLARAARLLRAAPFLLAAAVVGASNSWALADAASSAASKVFDVRGFTFHDGQPMPTVRLHYQTLGAPHRDARGEIDNAVLLLHGTGQDGSEFLAPSFAGPLFGAGEPLDAAKFFLIMPDSLGHGQSSKPSSGLRAGFPKYDYADMVALQHRLVVEGLGVRRLRLILGTSMGCMHTYLWGETFPDETRALMTMSCSPFPVAGENWLWRKGIIDAITLDPDWRQGNYRQQPATAMRAVAVLTGIAVSGAPNLAERFPTQADVDAMLRARTGGVLKLVDANDTLYQFSASSGYDAWSAPRRTISSTRRLCRTRRWSLSACRTFVTYCCRPARKPTVICPTRTPAFLPATSPSFSHVRRRAKLCRRRSPNGSLAEGPRCSKGFAGRSRRTTTIASGPRGSPPHKPF
jgi:homoserine O-acetyltransferase